jgi:RalA-binding protein 1
VDGERTRVHSTEEVERGQDGSPRPFLELDDEESENDRRISDDMHREKMIPDSDSEIDPERTDDVMVDFGYQRKRSDIATDQMQTPRVRIPGATADQFPLPPSSFVNATRGPNSPTTNGMNGLSAAPSVAASSSWASNITSTSTNELIPENNRDSFMPPSITPAATFRQMPLLNTDLKNATVEVVGSHIRPNDRGREVLCFVIGVNVVGKEGWTVCSHSGRPNLIVFR